MSVIFKLASHASLNINGTYDVIYELPNIHMKSLSVHTPSCFDFMILHKNCVIIDGKSDGLNVLPHNDVPFNLVCGDYLKLVLLNITQDHLEQQLTLNIESSPKESSNKSLSHNWIDIPWGDNTLTFAEGFCGFRNMPTSQEKLPDYHSKTTNPFNKRIVKLSKDECTRYNYYSEDSALRVLVKCDDAIAVLSPLNTLLTPSSLHATEYSVTLPFMDSITNISLSTSPGVKIKKVALLKTPDYLYFAGSGKHDDMELQFNNKTGCYEVEGLSDMVYMNTMMQTCTLRISLDSVMKCNQGPNEVPFVRLNFDRVTLDSAQRRYLGQNNFIISQCDVTLIKDTPSEQTSDNYVLPTPTIKV